VGEEVAPGAAVAAGEGQAESARVGGVNVAPAEHDIAAEQAGGAGEQAVQGVVDEQVVLDHAAAAELQAVAGPVGDHVAADGDVAVGGAEIEVVAEEVGRGAGHRHAVTVVVEDVVLDQQAVAAAGVEALAGEGAGGGVGVEDLAAADADVGR